MARHFLVLAIAGVMVVAIIAGALFLKSRSEAVSDSTATNPPQQGTTNPVSITVRLEEFCDYQSLACAALHPVLKKLREEFGPNLNVVFRNLPLADGNKNAVAAARAAEAARKQNKFWEMHDALFERQQTWQDQPNPGLTFSQLAKDIGLDASQFARDMDDEQIQFRIEADRDEAVRLGVDATPTVFINGRKLRAEAMSLEGIRRAIEITRKKNSTPE
jgi:protein-disulfide isomerase